MVSHWHIATVPIGAVPWSSAQVEYGSSYGLEVQAKAEIMYRNEHGRPSRNNECIVVECSQTHRSQRDPVRY